MARVLALVTFRVYPTLMGGQKGVAAFYHSLQQWQQVQLAVSSDNETDPAAPNAFPVLYANRRIFLNVLRLRHLQRIVREQGIDLIVAEHSYPAWMAYWLKVRTGRPFIIHSHNLEAVRFRQMKRWWWRLYGVYERWMHRKADYNFFISAADMAHAIRRFGLRPDRCTVITYGIDADAPLEEKQLPGIAPGTRILFFNGTLDYKPNYDAVVTLMEEVAPLLQEAGIPFRILVSGNRIPGPLQQRLERNAHCTWLGYVPDVRQLYRQADVFVNPVLNDSGVKTKVIEAIGNHCTVVSTRSGAAGIHRAVCGTKLVEVPDGRWGLFAAAIVQQLHQPPSKTPPSFFETYLWNNIAQKAAQKMSEVVEQYAK